MWRKSILAVIVALMMFAGTASAEVAGHLMLFDNDVPEEEMTSGMRGDYPDMPHNVVGVDINKTEFKYYDSLPAMMLALERGDIDYLNLQRNVGRYVLENNTNLILRGVSWYTVQIADTLNVAFLEKNSGLVKKFNEAMRP